MKKITFISILFFCFITNINAETKRIISGNESAKITIRWGKPKLYVEH